LDIITILLESFLFVQSIYQNCAYNEYGDCSGPHPCPSAYGMLRDPEHDRLLLVVMSAGEGIRISKNGLSGENHPLNPFFVDF
jgi:hypothetical protein